MFKKLKVDKHDLNNNNYLFTNNYIFTTVCI